MRVVFADSACVLATRQRLDALVLDVLAAPGMGGEALGQLRGFLDSEQLRRGTDAWERLNASEQPDEAWRDSA